MYTFALVIILTPRLPETIVSDNGILLTPIGSALVKTIVPATASGVSRANAFTPDSTTDSLSLCIEHDSLASIIIR